MEQNDKIRLLLDMHEHPESYTDEQLASMLDDEMLERLATAKRAMTDIPEPDVDAEWQRFEQEHFTPAHNRRWLKVAAMIAGVLMLSAFTYAAIQAVRAHQPEIQQPLTEQVEKTDALVATSSSTEAEGIDSVSTGQPVTFDNVALETIVGDIAARHQMQVDPSPSTTWHWKPLLAISLPVIRCRSSSATRTPARCVSTLFGSPMRTWMRRWSVSTCSRV